MTIPVSIPEQSPQRPARARRRMIIFRVGLVIAGVMGFFNTINGFFSLLDPTFGQAESTETPQPTWISVVLLACGLVTLVALRPAWRRQHQAIVTVIVSRLVSAWSAVALPFLDGAPDGTVVFVVVLVTVGTAVSVMVAQGLRSA